MPREGNRIFEEVIRVTDLFTTNDIVSNLIIENCLLVGPAILNFIGSTKVSGCSFDGPKQGILWETPPDALYLTGVVTFRDCQLLNCRTIRIGLAGPPDMIAAFDETPETQ